MKLLHFIFCIVIISSCGSKIYINDKTRYKIDKNFSFANFNTDSVIVTKGIRIPDSAVLINHLQIISLLRPDTFTLSSVDYDELEMAKAQAVKYKANVVDIQYFRRFFCCRPDELVVKLYHLNNEQWNEVRKASDSLNAKNMEIQKFMFGICMHLRKWLVKKINSQFISMILWLDISM